MNIGILVFNKRLITAALRRIFLFAAVLVMTVAFTDSAHASWLSDLPIIRRFTHRRHDPATNPNSSFEWENKTLTAKATAKLDGLHSDPIRVSRQVRKDSRDAALAKMQEKVEALRVAGNVKLGQLMRSNLSVRLAVEKWIAQNATISYDDHLSATMDTDGIISNATAKLHLKTLIPVLRKQGITPTSLPPVQPISNIKPIV